MIRITGLAKNYSTDGGTVPALRNVNLEVEDRERFGLFGRSGSGKSTLLRCLAGLERPDCGTITIGGVDVFDAEKRIDLPPWARPIGVVFQDFALWPHMRVLENVSFPLKHGRSRTFDKNECCRTAHEMLERVGLRDVARRFPAELSGGQRQRVAIARALICEPSVLLLDEPLSNLDPHLRRETRNELIDLLDESGTTTIIVSHEHFDSVFLTHTLGLMHRGAIVQKGYAEDVIARPADVWGARTLACGALVSCQLTGVAESGGATFLLNETEQHLDVPGDFSKSPQDAYFLLIPRNACRISAVGSCNSLQRLTGKVAKVGFTNAGWCVLVGIGATTIDVWESVRPQVARGDVIDLWIETSQICVLPSLAE